MKLISLEALGDGKYHAVFDVGECEVTVREEAELRSLTAPTSFHQWLDEVGFRLGAPGMRAVTSGLINAALSVPTGQKRLFVDVTPRDELLAEAAFLLEQEGWMLSRYGREFHSSRLSRFGERYVEWLGKVKAYREANPGEWPEPPDNS